MSFVHYMSDAIHCSKLAKWQVCFQPLIDAIDEKYPDKDWAEIHIWDVFCVFCSLPAESRREIESHFDDPSILSKYQVDNLYDLRREFQEHCLDSQYVEPYKLSVSLGAYQLFLYKGLAIEITSTQCSICEANQKNELVRVGTVGPGSSPDELLKRAVSIIDNPPEDEKRLIEHIEDYLWFVDPFWKNQSGGSQ